MSGSPLTRFQERVVSLASLEFSVGYPRFIDRQTRWERTRELIASVPIIEGQEVEVGHLTAVLGTAVGASMEGSSIALSGSVGIARVLHAVADGRKTLVTVPGFDSVAALAEEASPGRVTRLLVNPFDETDDVVASVIDAIDHTVGTVFLVSPDNPSGRVLSAQHLDSLSRACAVVDAVLVVDQCFALIDPFEFGVPMATNLGCRWCVLWDSSKTTELSGERVGVVLPGGDVGERVQASLNVVELEVPMTSVVAVRRMLEQLIGTVGLEMMNRAVADNYTLLKEACASAGIRVNRPDAGSFALVDLTETRFAEVPATCAEALLDRAGIAVAHSALFVPPGTRCSGFLRVSLARPTAAVELLCEKLAEHLR